MANKMENVVDLAKYIDQRVRVRFQVNDFIHSSTRYYMSLFIEVNIHCILFNMFVGW